MENIEIILVAAATFGLFGMILGMLKSERGYLHRLDSGDRSGRRVSLPFVLVAGALGAVIGGAVGALLAWTWPAGM